VRGILATGEVVADVVIFVPVIYAEGVGLKEEVKSFRTGTCSTIWTK
jgi:hypothetical protein